MTMPRCSASDEAARLRALHAMEILDSAPEECFDRITRIAKMVLQVPMALISLIDTDRQWFKSRQGLNLVQTPRSVSFCSHAIERDTPLIVTDAASDPFFATNPCVTGPPHIRYYAGIPLADPQGFNLGTLCCLDLQPREISAEQIAILEDLARLVVDEMELRLLATTDSLTGALTRRAFIDAASRDCLLAQRHQRPLTCLLIDADHFKAVNDFHGHALGDKVLRRLVQVCRQQLRSSDYIGRLGGEEFAIVLRETPAAAGWEVADRLRNLIAREVFEAATGPFSVTVSSGVASHDATVRDIDDLLERADTALYRAKAAGRNRCVLGAPGPGALPLNLIKGEPLEIHT